MREVREEALRRLRDGEPRRTIMQALGLTKGQLNGFAYRAGMCRKQREEISWFLDLRAIEADLLRQIAAAEDAQSLPLLRRKLAAARLLIEGQSKERGSGAGGDAAGGAG